ncbi:MAG: ornithine carbamoyltransferase [Natronosporangium sp.]
MPGATRHLISIEDLTDEELVRLVSRSADFAAGHRAPAALAGQVVGVLFRKTSTRTRTAFSAAALRLGAGLVSFGPDDLQTNTGETAGDTGRVLARMLDAVVARTAGDPQELRAWAGQDRMAVVNGLTSDEHPTQALADLTTLLGRFGRLERLRVLYLGEGNSTAAALALALSRFSGAELHLRTPAGYGLPARVRLAAERHASAHGALVTHRHDPTDLPPGMDVIYTTRWQTTGTIKQDPQWREEFVPFQVHVGLWRHSPGAVFMHDLPAHRGEEVAAEVLDGPASIAFDQAENKMHSATAVLEWCSG